MSILEALSEAAVVVVVEGEIVCGGSDALVGVLLKDFLVLSRRITTSSTQGNKSRMASSVTSADKFLSTATLSVHFSVGVD